MRVCSFKNSLIVLFLLLISCSLRAQREFSFNQEGNQCHFQYLCYAPNNNYNNVRRPVILILGKENETPLQTFEKDEMKDLPQFYHYLFVYVPNSGGRTTSRLECLESLGSLITYGYAYGHANMFLRVTDPEIRQQDIETTALDKTFKSINLSEGISTPEPTTEIVADFAEDTEAYGAIEITEEDTYGTFYIAEEEKEQFVFQAKVTKTYFGPPKTFDFTLSGIVRDRACFSV